MFKTSEVDGTAKVLFKPVCVAVFPALLKCILFKFCMFKDGKAVEFRERDSLFL